MGNVLPFRDPAAALDGAERDHALTLYRAGLQEIVQRAIAGAFTEAARQPDCERLGCEAVLPIFCQAIQEEIDRMEVL